MSGDRQPFFLPEEQMLREQLIQLKEEMGCCSLKVSTEDAGQSYFEIGEVYRLFNDILPIQAKIGGPEARQDIIRVVDIGCTAIIAPMIESPFALRKFVHSVRECLSQEQYERVGKQINIETITACRNFEAMLTMKEMRDICQVTVGRTDLCRSMELPPESDEVMEEVRKVVELSRSAGIVVSVGGRITPRDARVIVDTCQPDRVNTRDVGFSVRNAPDPGSTVKSILQFEVALIKYQEEIVLRQVSFMEERIRKIRGRLHR